MSAKKPSRMFNPTGTWRCTRSTFRQFVVGETYPCLPDKVGTGYRIYPELEIGAWSPYWVPQKGRFCYESKDLDFEFVGPIPAKEKAEMISKRDTTLPKSYAHVRFPIKFAEDDAPSAPPARKKLKIAAFIRSIMRDVIFFLLGIIACLIVYIAFG